MVQESTPLMPQTEESIEAETDTAVEPEPESGELLQEPTREPGFVCDCEEWMRSACKGLPFYKEHERRRYCVLHYRGKEKRVNFKAVLDRKLNNKDFDFRGVRFPDDIDFSGFEFSADVDFSYATFNASAAFSSALFTAAADFSHATFSAVAKFSHVTFSSSAGFTKATFGADADFTNGRFSADASFSDAEFSAEADFSNVRFSAAAYFSDATFSSAVSFSYAMFSSAAGFTSAIFRAASLFTSATFSSAAVFTLARFCATASFRYATFKTTADFRSATFGGIADFRLATLSEPASFSSATFSSDALFRSAAFNGAVDFSSATFSLAAYFESATFSADVDFSSATFSANTYFTSAAFSDANFNLSVFHARADFSRTTFNDSIHFFGSATERHLKDGVGLDAMALGKDPSLHFQHVRIEHPERITLHTLNLRPHWFVNVDSRRFVFTDVGWEWERISINQEIAALETNHVSSPNRLLAIACRQLAENAETNNRYEEASRFRYWAMDLARRIKWKGWSFWRTDWLHMLYWAVSGYGERIWLAFLWVLAVWIVFASLYTQVGFTKPESKSETPTSNPVLPTEPDTIGQPLSIKRVWTYSLAVMSLQKPEPKPLTGTAQALVLLQTILGPVQAALLALAIRRKFMR
jgi:hypothetical protein